MTPQDLIDDLRSRINPLYAAQLGTESYERRLCVEAIEALVHERDALDAEAERLSAHATELRNQRDALSKLADKWNFECDELREDNKRLAAEVKTLRDALERTLTALENEGPTFWSAEQDAARAALGETK